MGIRKLFTEPAPVALVELATDALLGEKVEAVAEGLELDLVYDFADEGYLEQRAGLVFADASLSHVKEGGLIQLSYG